MQLNQIKDKGTYVIVRMNETIPCVERLMDLGLHPGETIRIRHEAPLGDPISIEFRDSHISVRLEDAAHLIVESAQA